MSERIVLTSSSAETSALFGTFDENVKEIENAFGVHIANRKWNVGDADAIVITGEEVAVCRAERTFKCLLHLTGAGDNISKETLAYAINLVTHDEDSLAENIGSEVMMVTNKGKPIKAKTAGQKRYVEMIKKETLILGVGPAGTGKTFLAVAMAVLALRERRVDRIVLTRPAVEAGERLGFLPGDLQSKIDPYLRPLYDALFEMLGPENFAKHMERGTIEIAPLAYMRGRTLDSSFIILDEAQNTTEEQMKMFLTRLGSGSKAVVTGDLSQTDLPDGKKSGLCVAKEVLKNVEGVGIFEFSPRDVVRHHLVQRIIEAYDKYDREKKERRKNN